MKQTEFFKELAYFSLHERFNCRHSKTTTIAHTEIKRRAFKRTRRLQRTDGQQTQPSSRKHPPRVTLYFQRNGTYNKEEKKNQIIYIHANTAQQQTAPTARIEAAFFQSHGRAPQRLRMGKHAECNFC